MISAEFESKRVGAKNWLDNVVKHQKALLHYGNKNYNEFGITIAGLEKSIHIYNNGNNSLETLAFYLGKTITYEPNVYDDMGRMSFEYDGFTVFQLWEKS